MLRTTRFALHRSASVRALAVFRKSFSRKSFLTRIFTKEVAEDIAAGLQSFEFGSDQTRALVAVELLGIVRNHQVNRSIICEPMQCTDFAHTCAASS